MDGVDRSGRFAALTNYTEPTPDPLPQTTRGDLITKFLVGEQSAKAYMTSLPVPPMITGVSTFS